MKATVTSPERREEPGLRLFLQAISRYPSLTSAEESRLLHEIRGGAREPLDTLINANLRHVAGIAGEFLDRGLTRLDLIAEGTVALIRAARLFDPCGHSSFARFADGRIRLTILGALGEST